MAAKKKVKIRRSPAEVRKMWQKLEPQLAKERVERERQGQTFTSITREEFEAKLKRVHSPMIVSQGWNPTVPLDGTINYGVQVVSFDVWPWSNLALAVSIGNRNPIVSNDEFLTTFDARFPTYAQPAPNGFSPLTGLISLPFWFQIKIPPNVEKTGYFGNCVLQKISFLDRC